MLEGSVYAVQAAKHLLSKQLLRLSAAAEGDKLVDLPLQPYELLEGLRVVFPAVLVDRDVCVDRVLAGLAAPQDSLDGFPVLLLRLAYGGQLFRAHLLVLCLVEEAQLAHLVLQLREQCAKRIVQRFCGRRRARSVGNGRGKWPEMRALHGSLLTLWRLYSIVQIYWELRRHLK